LIHILKKTKEYNDLVDFLFRLYGDRSNTEELANDIRIFCRSLDGIRNLRYLFEEHDLRVKDSKDADKLMELIQNLADNTRVWANNGYTPGEMEEMRYGK